MLVAMHLPGVEDDIKNSYVEMAPQYPTIIQAPGDCQFQLPPVRPGHA